MSLSVPVSVFLSLSLSMSLSVSMFHAHFKLMVIFANEKKSENWRTARNNYVYKNLTKYMKSAYCYKVLSGNNFEGKGLFSLYSTMLKQFF
jgi:hypothetical protein